MTFGGQSVTITTVGTTGNPGFLGVKTETRSSVTVSGCRGRVMSVDEIDTATDIATEIWKFTLPPVAAALNASPTGEISYGGRVFQIDGPPAPKFDLDGQVHHVTIMAKRQAG